MNNLTGKMNSIRNYLKGKNFGVFLAFVILVIALSIATPVFFTGKNLLLVMRQAVWFAIMGFGMTFVIGMGGIDLSVGSTLAICGLLLANMILGGMNIFLAIIIVLIVGMAIGFINGLLVAKLKIPDFIATLSIMSITRGIALVYSEGLPIYGLRFPEFQFIGQGYLWVIPFPIIIMLVICALCFFLMYRTKYGRYTLSIGSSADAARLVGINIDKIKIMVYSMMGLLAAVASVILTSRLEAAMPDAGDGYELDVIAATVIGGTSMSGGKASIIGTLIGAIMMAVVRNGLNLLNINTFWHQVAIGAIILIAVVIDQMTTKNKNS